MSQGRERLKKILRTTSELAGSLLTVHKDSPITRTSMAAIIDGAAISNAIYFHSTNPEIIPIAIFVLTARRVGMTTMSYAEHLRGPRRY